MGDVEEVATQDRPEGAEEEGAARRHREERERNVDLVDDVVEGPRVEAFVELAHRPLTGYPRRLSDLGEHIHRPELPECVARFIAEQRGLDPDADEVDLHQFYAPDLHAVAYPSAVATFYAPGDPSGPTADPEQPGFRGLHAVRIRLFFSFTFLGVYYPCALVEWFTSVGDEPDDLTGMWVVEPEIDEDGTRPCEVIHLDTVFRAAHLEPVHNEKFTPRDLKPEDSLDAFVAYYINKWVDYHAHQHLF